MRLSEESLSTSSAGSGVASFFATGLVSSRRDFARHGEPGAVDHDIGVESEAAVLIAEPFGDAAAGFGAGEMGFAGQAAKIGLGVSGVRDGAEFLFELALAGDARGREAGNARDRARRRGWGGILGAAGR